MGKMKIVIKILSFVYRKPKETAIIILALLLAVTLLKLKHTQEKSYIMQAKTQELPKDTKQVVTIYKNKVIIKWREGPTKIEYRERYLPPEGKVEIITKENEPNKPPEVKVKDWGFTANLGGGVVYSGKFEPMLDLKWFYWKRYGLTLGVTRQGVGLGVSRHLDDVFLLRNSEICVLYFNKLFIGLRLNF